MRKTQGGVPTLRARPKPGSEKEHTHVCRWAGLAVFSPMVPPVQRHSHVQPFLLESCMSYYHSWLPGKRVPDFGRRSGTRVVQTKRPRCQLATFAFEGNQALGKLRFEPVTTTKAGQDDVLLQCFRVF